MTVEIPARTADLPEPPLLDRIRDSVIGDDQVIPGPYGSRRVTYADYTASGRALGFLEEFIADEVLPRYANTHTESSGTGLQTTRLREDARAVIHRALGGDDQTCVLFAGSGSTGAIDRLIGMLGLRVPSVLEDRYGFGKSIPARQRPVVLVGPFEHHSNELPWRESIAEVIRIREDSDGHIDLQELGDRLQRLRSEDGEDRLVIGSFSAASNVTGIVTDTDAVSALLHRFDALAFWDFAAAAPYVSMRMTAPADGDPLAYKDAIVLSPHKFIGGPGTPGVLAVRRPLLTNRVPDVVGGGTVAYVNPNEHVYLADPEHREEGGTPAIVESIRAGLVFQLKEAVGTAAIRAHEEDYVRRAIAAWSAVPEIRVLGNTAADRLSIVSFVVQRADGKYLHHNAVVALLNDLFGIQSRGGCSCAGPYGHRLLAIDIEQSHAYEREITRGCEGIKPGWVRVNFNYFISEEVFRYVVQAVAFVARHGEAFLPDYTFDVTAGLWRHRAGPPEPPLRLSEVTYDADGAMRYPHHRERAPRAALTGYLRAAEALLAEREHRSAAGGGDAQPATIRSDFDALRWFVLPQACLAPA